MSYRPIEQNTEQIALTSPRDSSLESIHRKQEKGWTRAGGTVKEDSRSLECFGSFLAGTC